MTQPQKTTDTEAVAPWEDALVHRDVERATGFHARYAGCTGYTGFHARYVRYAGCTGCTDYAALVQECLDDYDTAGRRRGPWLGPEQD